MIALRLLAACPEGLTDFELAQLSGKAQTSIGCRRGELAKLGFVTAKLVDGAIATRPAPSGAAATVWTLTPAGVERAEGPA